MTTICETEIAAGEVRIQLERILTDRRFAAAERTASFLRYVVEKTLAGLRSEIKEIVIATDVYARSADYDPKIDSIVRVEATRLRNKLDSYYEEEGATDPIRVTIPKGGYVPEFKRREIEAIAFDTEIVGTQTGVPLPPLREESFSQPGLSPRWWIALASLCLVVLLAWNQRGGWAAPVRPDMLSSKVHPEAVAAWEEGKMLLSLDPHSANSEQGAPQTLLRAIERFEYAVAAKPSFAPAWASLAEAYEYAFPYVGRNSDEDAKRAEVAARRAVALDKTSARAHATLALVLFYLRWDLPAAETEYRRAIELDPRLAYPIVEYADLLRETGRTERAEFEIRKARALLPALPVLASKQAEIALDRMQPEEAIAAASSAIQFERDYTRAYVARGMAYESQGLLPQALEQYRIALKLDSLDRRALPAAGYLLARMGRHKEAQAVLQQLLTMNSRVRNCAFQIALVYTGMGDRERALDWLERAYSTRQQHVPFMNVERRLEPLRRDPRFRAIVSRIGLTPSN